MISSKFYDFIERYFRLTKIKVFIRYFLYVKNFAKKFSSSSCESLLGVGFFIMFFAYLRMSLEYFEILSSVCHSNIA